MRVETHDEELRAFVGAQVEKLRRKLLDLSSRNPLVTTRFSPRSAAHLRVVDELPEVLLSKLSAEGRRMRLAPLPPLNVDPADETSRRFQDALSAARVEDEAYQAELDSIDPEAENAADLERKAERALRDRMRVTLGLPPRATKGAESLPQHARNNGVDPSYDLPEPTRRSQRSHQDDDIQLLLLPEDLARKCRNLLTKVRDWEQERGVNVFHMAFGFLHWSDGPDGKELVSPLVMLPARLEQERTPNGHANFVSAEGEPGETNVVLIEKLRAERGVEIPRYEGGSIEKYFEAVADLAPRGLTWKLRRQVAIGVWPSQSLAMYRDLDPERGFRPNEAVLSIIGGMSEKVPPAPIAEEHDVDAPEIEALVPALVMDADSSQFSALVDIAQGRNLAIEGPPGTGKSQTIVNAIANALMTGRKVLFVAEKAAALDVVRSRLEALGLGDFVLPLIPGRTTKTDVLARIRKRMEMKPPQAVSDLKVARKRRDERRAQLRDYLDLLDTTFAATERKVSRILHDAARTAPRLDDLPVDFRRPVVLRPEDLTSGRIADLLGETARAADAWSELSALGDTWAGSGLLRADRLLAEALAEQAGSLAEDVAKLMKRRRGLGEYGPIQDTEPDALDALAQVLKQAEDVPERDDQRIGRLSGLDADAVRALIGRISEVQTGLAELGALVDDPASTDWPDRLDALVSHCREHGLKTRDPELEKRNLDLERDALKNAQYLCVALRELVEAEPAASNWTLEDIRAARDLADSVGPALAGLTPTLAQTGGVLALREVCRERESLVEEEGRLAKTIRLETDLAPGELRALGEAAGRTGFLAWLSGGRRHARRRLRSIFRVPVGDWGAASQHVEALAAFKAAERDFREEPRNAALFGLGWRGLRTDFAAFERLALFLEAVDKRLAGPSRQTLRTILRSGDVARIALLPVVPSVLSGTVESFTEGLKDREAAIERRDTAIRELDALGRGLRPTAPKRTDSLASLSEVIRKTRDLAAIIEDDDLGKKALGNDFSVPSLDVAALSADLRLAEEAARLGPLQDTVVSLFSRRNLAPIQSEIQEVANEARVVSEATLRLARDAEMPVKPLPSSTSDLEAFRSKLLDLAAKPEALFRRASFNQARSALADHGLAWALDALAHFGRSGAEWASVVEATLHRAMAVALHDAHGNALARFGGRKLDKLRAEFAELDKDCVRLAARAIADAAYRTAKPPAGVAAGSTSVLRELGLLHRVVGQKRPRVALRDLVERAGGALRELKPCWMMSPQAVATYLPRGAEAFEIVLIDEASQMTPENAIGALSRAQQAVVVGDVNQLPPSNFFQRMVGATDDGDDDGVVEESVLELANATFQPRRRLRWHYRSRHAGLIRFSNDEIYDGDLVIFPSASESRSKPSVSLRKIEGLYKSGVNPIEAKAMVEAAVDFMRRSPNRSLGLVVMNQAQRELLEEEYAHARAADLAVQAYEERWEQSAEGLERFFIKNLENVQGDERDVMFIGTVYGPERPGAPVMQRFGPIAGIAGKRRLNVLFSRAKLEMVTFTSLSATDVKGDGNPGRDMLRRWLDYASTGVIAKPKIAGGPESPLEKDVLDRIRALGLEADPQVGAAGYYIDIGIRHPSGKPGYVLGVECDGATYHSSRSARDRDRLRQQVLEARGWALHRIWSTDWFNDARGELDRLKKRLEQRTAEIDEIDKEPVASAALEPRIAAEVERVVASDVTAKVEAAIGGDAQPVTALASQQLLELRSIDGGARTGDRVRLRYLDGSCSVLSVILSAEKNDAEQGLVHISSPLGRSIEGAEEGDQIEVLVGPYIRKAVVEQIESATASPS